MRGPLAFEFTHAIVRRIAQEQITPGRRLALRQQLPRQRERGMARPPNPVDVVILPFAVTDAVEHHVFGEGMLDLLATALDGTAGLRCADARLVLEQLSTPAAAATPAERGRLLAKRFGARWFVLGQLLATGGRVRIAASLFEVDALEPVGRFVVDGAETDLLDLIDRTAVELLLRLGAGGRSTLLPLFQRPTTSIAALRAYLEGEAALRRGELDRAVDAFEAAVAHDAGFALAYYRLAHALEWTFQPDNPRRLAEAVLAAVRLEDRLPEQMRVLVRACHASLRGAGEEAVRLFRSVAAVAPDNVEAWYGLGGAIFYYARLWGGSMLEAREPFEQVLAREPEHLAAETYLASIAGAEGRKSELRAYSEHILERHPRSVHFSWRLGVQVQLAYVLGDAELQERVGQELRSGTETDLDTLLVFPFLVIDDLQAAWRATSVFIELASSPARKATGTALLAALELVGGRWSAARRRLEEAATFDQAQATAHLALFATTPLLARPREELAGIRELLRSCAGSGEQDVQPYFLQATHAGLYPRLLRYLEGMLSARLEEWETAESAATWLGTAEHAPALPTLGPGLAARLRAWIAAARGAPEDAIRALDRAQPEVPWPWLVASGILSGAHERFLRAEQLVALGRGGDADRWFAAATGLSPVDVVLLAPAALRRGERAEAAGDLDAAALYYGRFIELWRDCDPELRPLVDATSRRLSRLRTLRGSTISAAGAWIPD